MFGVGWWGMKIIDIVWLEMPGAKVFQLTVPNLKQIQRELGGRARLRHLFAESELDIPEDMADKVLVARGASAQSFIEDRGFTEAVCPTSFIDTIVLVVAAVRAKCEMQSPPQKLGKVFQGTSDAPHVKSVDTSP